MSQVKYELFEITSGFLFLLFKFNYAVFICVFFFKFNYVRNCTLVGRI